MSKSATSVFVFAIYIFLLGPVLLLIPEIFLKLISFPEADGLWIRVCGMLLIILGAYYLQAARNELTAFFTVCAYGRISVLGFLIAFVLLGYAPPLLILFGTVDASAGIWTLLSLRADRRSAADD